MRTSLLAVTLALLSATVPGSAQEPAPVEPVAIDLSDAEPVPIDQATAETLGIGTDRTERMTVPVSIGGSGPFSFIVDTGAERTVISRELAQRLRLDPGRSAIMYSMTEASRVDTVVIPELEVGLRTVNDIHAPALSQRHLGAEGLLGVDSLRSQRVELDFIRQEMTVTPSRRREERWPSDTIVVTARSRYGHLMLVDAAFDGQRVYVIVDTGSQVTVANSALRQRLERRRRLGPLLPIELISVTGNVLHAEYGIARRIKIGGVDITNLPVAFADVHPFQKLDLTDHPAILLGMDALQLFERVSFDFANRRVRLRMRETSQSEPPVRYVEQQAPAPPVAG